MAAEAVEPDGIAPPGRPPVDVHARRVGIFLVVGFVLLLVLPVLGLWAKRSGVFGSHALPDLGPAPQFSLVDQASRPVTSSALQGSVTVADFVFIECTDSCPMLTSRMKNLQRAVGEEGKKRGAPLPVRYVSFSLDPARDGPEKLAEYAAKYQADTSTWSFLTGPEAHMNEVVIRGFKVASTRVPTAKGSDILHGNWFILIDRRGHVRGYYNTDAQTAEGSQAKAILADVLALVAEP